MVGAHLSLDRHQVMKECKAYFSDLNKRVNFLIFITISKYRKASLYLFTVGERKNVNTKTGHKYFIKQHGRVITPRSEQNHPVRQWVLCVSQIIASLVQCLIR